MSHGLMTAAYIGSMILFILALGGLSHQESARRGNLYGMLGMVVAVLATLFAVVTDHYVVFIVVLIIGGSIGIVLARRVQMTQMPELVAILHSLVGLAAVLVGFANFLGPTQLIGIELTIHNVETYVGIFIGAVTFSGSTIAFGKLSGKIGGRPLALPARHWLNLIALVLVIWLAVVFLGATSTGVGIAALLGMTVLALALGVHMVMAIGGADMPVVISMLNSYSGWAAAATGFMLGNDLLIVTGALVGSSGAILSYIMCRAMNRHFLAVIAGGFGSSGSSQGSSDAEQGEVHPLELAEAAAMLGDAHNVVIVPGYGMAVAQAQHAVHDLTKALQKKGIKVRFAIHPVAGRMPGHMNVLLAEANVPYDIVFEMDELNDDFPDVDVSIVIGANDIVNPAAEEVPDSPIAGMPVLKVWNGKATFVLKRSMATGYAGVENPLFFKDNTYMLFGDARDTLTGLLRQLSE